MAACLRLGAEVHEGWSLTRVAETVHIFVVNWAICLGQFFSSGLACQQASQTIWPCVLLVRESTGWLASMSWVVNLWVLLQTAIDHSGEKGFDVAHAVACIDRLSIHAIHFVSPIGPS